MAPKVILGGGLVLEIIEVVGQPLSENSYWKRNFDGKLSPECVRGEEFVHHPDDRGALSIRYSVKDFTDLVRVLHRD